MTINFDTITNNYEVIYLIKTVMTYHLKKIIWFKTNVFTFNLITDVTKDGIGN
jgi:hypothetical protein